MEGKDLLASLLLGVGGMSQTYGQGLERRNVNKENMMDVLTKMYFQNMFEQQSPYSKYLKHLMSKQGAGKEEDLLSSYQLYGAVKDIEAKKGKELAGDVQRKQLIESYTSGREAPIGSQQEISTMLPKETQLSDILGSKLLGIKAEEPRVSTLGEIKTGKELGALTPIEAMLKSREVAGGETGDVIGNAVRMSQLAEIPETDIINYIIENGGNLQEYIQKYIAMGGDEESLTEALTSLGID